MCNEGKLAGRKAIVTGSGTGIGREIALEFARQGADVVLHYAHSDKGAKSAAEEIKSIGRKVTAIKANFDIVKDVVKLAEQAIKFLGKIDCLVNNAGITFNKPFLDVTPEQFDTMWHVNMRGQFFLTQRVVMQMLKQSKGSICNLTSIHGLQGASEHSVYAGTKGAIIAYTRSLAIELAHKGIRVNAIAPGCINVENYYKVLPDFSEDNLRKDAKKGIPLGRPGTPLDIARLAVFLCSDDSEFIVGQTIVADGGTSGLMSMLSDFRTKSKARFGKGYLPGV